MNESVDFIMDKLRKYGNASDLGKFIIFTPYGTKRPVYTTSSVYGQID